MRNLYQNNLLDFDSKDAAFEFLVQESQRHFIKEHWKKELDQLKDIPKGKNDLKRRFKFSRVAVFAITLILLLVSYFWYIKLDDSIIKVANKMLVETNISAVSNFYTRGFAVQGEGNLAIELQNEITTALTQKDYNSAIGLFFTKEKQIQLSVEDKFYYALSISQLENADFYKALRLLEDVTVKNEKFVNESLWLQGLLFLKIGNPIKAKITLNKLYSSSNYQKKNASILLKRLDEMK